MRVFPVVLGLLLIPLCSASTGATVESSHAPELTGAIDQSFRDGIAHTTQVSSAEFTFSGLHGEAILYSWRAAAAGSLNVEAEQAQPILIPLENATLTGTVVAEYFSLGIEMTGGGVVGAAGAAGGRPERPGWLAAEWSRSAFPARIPLAAPQLDLRAPRGWGAIGHVADRTLAHGPRSPVVSASGEGSFDLDGGNITILHSNGTSERFRLSPTIETDGEPLKLERHFRLIFTGTIGDADIPLEDYWLVAGPRPEWHIDGSADWPRASGTEGGVAFKDQPVHVEGSFSLTPDPSRNGALDADLFALEGDYSLSAAGVALTPEPARAAPPVAAWTIASVLAALLAWFGSPHLAGRIVAPFYTRIARDDIATHPARSRICEHLTQAPGVHLRDLHRRIGGAWGTFSFHLGMLRQAGVIRFERDGRYVAIYLAHQEIARAGPRTVTAQKVLEALPHDGSPMPVTKLRERVGLSRQLLDHHLAALVQQERIVIDAARPRRVSRIVAR